MFYHLGNITSEPSQPHRKLGLGATAVGCKILSDSLTACTRRPGSPPQIMLQSGGASAFSPRGMGATRSMNLARSPSGSSGGAAGPGASSLIGSRMLLLYAAAAFAVGYVGSLWIQRGDSTASGHHPSEEAAHQRLQGVGNEAAVPAPGGNTSAPSLPLMYVYPLPPDVYLGGIPSTSVYRKKDMEVRAALHTLAFVGTVAAGAVSNAVGLRRREAGGATSCGLGSSLINVFVVASPHVLEIRSHFTVRRYRAVTARRHACRQFVAQRFR